MKNKLFDKFKFKSILAFTLAEVLITLTVIGVLASMTIPALMQNIQKGDLKQSLKEAHSILSNSYTRLKTDNGLLTTDNALYNYYTSIHATNPDQFAKDMTKYMLVQKDCTEGVGAKMRCVDTYGKILSTGQYYTDFFGNPFPTGSMMHYVGTYQYILSNGMILFFYNESNVNWNRVTVDINGFKGPNSLGKDAFLFDITTNNKLMPRSTIWANPTICKTSNTDLAHNSLIGCTNAALYDEKYWDLW